MTRQYDLNDGRRSPRDRSPMDRDRSPRRYLDSRDSDTYRGATRGGERRRSPSVSRANTASFNHNQNRELFSDRHIPPRDTNRDSSLRDPPRGPRAGSKSYIDPPSGPRGNSFGDGYRGDFSYRGGRGRGRGRGSWRDESRDRDRDRDRDRGRDMDRERDYRDMRRDTRGPLVPFRDERSRDREWDGRDSFKGRRPSSPLGRGRSPNYISRDTRDAPSSLDLDRARRGSRDGPMSVTSPSSESSQPFVHGYGRARGNGVGRGRGRPYYIEEYYHRPQVRSRSPEPSFSRRNQPSATPPPQVPAFGSGGASASLSQSPVPGVSIPTAPRFYAGRGSTSNHYVPAKSIIPHPIEHPLLESRSETQVASTPEHKVEETARVNEKRRHRKPLFGRCKAKIPVRDDYSDSDLDPFNDDDPEDEINFESELAEVEHKIYLAESRPDPPSSEKAIFVQSYLDEKPLVSEDAQNGSDAFMECTSGGAAADVKTGTKTESTIESELEPKPETESHSEPQQRPHAMLNPSHDRNSTEIEIPFVEDPARAVPPSLASPTNVGESVKYQQPIRELQTTDATNLDISKAPLPSSRETLLPSSLPPSKDSIPISTDASKDSMAEDAPSQEQTGQLCTNSSHTVTSPVATSTSISFETGQSLLEGEHPSPKKPTETQPLGLKSRLDPIHSKDHSLINEGTHQADTYEKAVTNDDLSEYPEPLAIQLATTAPTEIQSLSNELSLLPRNALESEDLQTINQDPFPIGIQLGNDNQDPFRFEFQLLGARLTSVNQPVQSLQDHAKDITESSLEGASNRHTESTPIATDDASRTDVERNRKSESRQAYNSLRSIATDVLPDAHAVEDDSPISPKTKDTDQLFMPEVTNDNPIEEVVSGIFRKDEPIGLRMDNDNLGHSEVETKRNHSEIDGTQDYLQNQIPSPVPQAPELVMEVPEESDDDDKAEQAGFDHLREELIKQQAALEEDRQLRVLESVKHPRDTRTPPLESLPTFDYNKWDEDEEFLSLLANQDTEPSLMGFIEDKMSQRRREKEDEGQMWISNYIKYRRFTDKSDDAAAVKSREVFSKARHTEAEELAEKSKLAAGSELRGEGQRRTGGRFGTEHDIERVLRESEREAKESREQKEQDAREHTANSKEATIPDMCWDEEYQERMFLDTTHKIPFDRSFRMLEFGESVDNFTKEEARMFEEGYVKFSKQFSIIAESLPDRDYQTCIQHYYIVKATSEWRAKHKKDHKNKQKQAKRKYAKKSSSALPNNDNGGGNETDATPDVENGNERRRLRRAAAPIFNSDALALALATDNEGASPAPTSAKKVATPKGESNGESAPTKRKPKVPKEKAPKQPKGSQMLAVTPSLANSNGESSVPASTAVTPEPTPIRPPIPARFAAMYDDISHHQQPTFTPPFMPPERLASANLEVPSAPERIASALPIGVEPQPNRRSAVQQQTSSYWSVPETTDFPALLRHFGTDWNAIARHMGTKTHTMVYKDNFSTWLNAPKGQTGRSRQANIAEQVKNYFQRMVDSGNQREWENITREADLKRERGESTGAPPTPSVTTKRRNDPTPAPLSRSASAMDLDELSANQPMILPQTSPSQPVLSTRFPALAQAGTVPHSMDQSINPSSLPSKRSHHQANQQSLSQIQQQQQMHLTQQAPPQQLPVSAPPATTISQLQSQPQQMQSQQARQSRGPAMGFFTTDNQRPMISQQSQSSSIISDPAAIASQRSARVAEEAEFERRKALEQEQKRMKQQQQQALQQQALQENAYRQREQQQRERELREREIREREMRDREMRNREMRDREMRDREMRDREMRDREMRDREMRDREMRDREMREREMREREMRELRELREMENRANEQMQLQQQQQQQQQRRERERELEREQLERSLKRKQERDREQDRRERRERNFQLKQEKVEVRNTQQYEIYPASSSRTGSMAPSRPDAPYSAVSTIDARRQAAPPAPHQQYPPRSQVQISLLNDSMGVPQNMIQSPSPAFGRLPISTPPIQEQYSTPPPPPAAVTAIRQQDTPRKTSNIMSLLNDDSSEPSRAPPPPAQVQSKRSSNPTAVSMQSSRTPPPPQHTLQTSRYSQQIHPQMQQSQQMQQVPHQISSQPNPQHGYSQGSSQSMHQHSSSVGRSYTPTPYEGRSHVPQPAVQHRPMYVQPSRQAIGSQPSSIRREPLNEMNAPGGYTRSPVTKLNESPYSATPPPGGQQRMTRQPISSPHDLSQASEREIYNRQSQFAVPQQSNTTVEFHSTPQVATGHRSMAFGQSGHLTPPTRGQWVPPHQVDQHMHASRQSSFDGRNYSAPTSAAATAQQIYAQAPPHHMQYQKQQQQQQQQQPQERYDYDRERERERDRQDRHDREQYYRRGDDPRDPRDPRR